MRNKLTAIIGSVMSAIIALLGFSSCDGSDALMYGCPHGTFKVSGNVTDEAGAPVAGAGIIVKILRSDEYPVWPIDTLTTDKAGKYNGKEYSIYPEDDIRLVCEDPGGEFAPDSVTVDPHYTGGGKDWFIGTANERVDFKLKKAEKE